MPANHIGTGRTPAWGILAGGARVVVSVDKSIDMEREMPFLLVSSKTTTTIGVVTPTSVELINTARMPVVYGLVIIPRAAVDAVKTPWKSLWTQLREKLHEMRTGVVDPKEP